MKESERINIEIKWRYRKRGRLTEGIKVCVMAKEVVSVVRKPHGVMKTKLYII